MRIFCGIVSVLAGVAAAALALLWVFPDLQLLGAPVAIAATFIPLIWIPTLAALVFGIGWATGWVRLLPVIGVVLVAAWLAFTIVPLGAQRQPEVAALKYVYLNAQYGRADVNEVRELIREDTDIVVIVEFTPELQQALETPEFTAQFPHQVGEARIPGADGTVIYSARPIKELARVDDLFLNVVAETTTAAGEPIKVAGVHLIPPIRSAATWNDDARKVAAMLAPHAKDDLVVLGDFNAVEQHVAFRHFTDLGLRDAGAHGSWGALLDHPTWPEEHRMPPFARIDHLLISERFDAPRSEFVTVRGTDHKALRGSVGYE